MDKHILIYSSNFWRRIFTLMMCVNFLWWNLAYAAPQGGQVVAGGATITQNGNVTQISQTTAKAVINWSSFDTSAAEQVNFSQPSANAIALNRITSGLPTMFAGLLTANGQVWILNPAGVLFTKTSRVDVSGLLVSTSDIANNDFMNGNYQFTAVPGFENGAVVNEGEIIAHGGSVAGNGLVALVAPGVANDGVISANLGKVVLASGTAYTLDLYGDQLIQFATDSKVQQVAVAPDGRILKDAVSNNGKIEANGGQVLLTANTAGKIVDNVISMNGVIEAKTATQGKNGVIILGGDEGSVKVSGNIDVSADKNGNAGKVTIKGDRTLFNGTITAKGGSESGNGGFVETSGNYIDVDYLTLDLTAANGNNGTWLIDPRNIEVTASTTSNNSGATSFTPTGNDSKIAANLIVNQLNAGTNVILDTGAAGNQQGNITISAAITKTTNNTAGLTLTAANNVAINQAIDLSVGTGSLTINAGGTVGFNANTLIGGNLNVTSGGNVSQTSKIVVTGTSSFNAGSNSITLTNANNDFTGAVSLSNSGNNDVAIRDVNGLTLGILNIGRDLTITTAGALAFNGAAAIARNLIANTTNAGGITQTNALTVSGASSFTVGNNAITLTNANNDFSGAVTFSNSGSNNVSVTDKNAIVLGTSTIGGNFAVNTTGAITQANASSLTIGGSSSFSAGANAITLANANNDFSGAVAFSNSGSNNVSVTDKNAIVLGTSTIGGDLTVNAGGAITQLAGSSLTINGASSFNAGNNAITLSNAGNNFIGAVSLTNSGNNDVTINDSNALNFGTSSIGRNLVVTANGAIIQAGGSSLTIGGTSSFSAGANAITLANANNDFSGALSFSNSGSNNVSVTDKNAIVLGTSTIGGDLTVNAGGAITQLVGSSLTINGASSFSTGNNAITLSNAGNNFIGAVLLNNSGNKDVTINDQNALVFGTSTIGRDLTVTAGGAISQLAGSSLTVKGDASFNAGNNSITLSNAGNDFIGEVTLQNSGSNDVSITDKNTLTLGASTIGKDLTVDATLTHLSGGITAGTSINFLKAVTLDTNVNLTAPNVNFSTVSSTIDGNGKDLTVTGSGSFVAIDDVDHLLVTGNAVFNGLVGAISPLNFIHVQGATTIATAGITTNKDQTYDGAVTVNTDTVLTGDAVVFNDAVSGSNDLTINTKKDFTISHPVTLTNASLTISSDGGVHFQGVTTVGGDLSVVAGGDIDQTKELLVTGTSHFDAGNNAITLSNANNDFGGEVTLQNGANKNVVITDVNDLTLGASNIGGDLTVD